MRDDTYKKRKEQEKNERETLAKTFGVLFIYILSLNLTFFAYYGQEYIDIFCRMLLNQKMKGRYF